MTVRRSSTVEVKASRQAVVKAIHKACDVGYRLKMLESGGDVSVVRYKPVLWPLFLSVKVSLTLADSDGATAIEMHSKSQPYVYGDIFHTYNWSMRVIANKIKEQI